MRYTALIEDKGFSDFSPCDLGREDCAPSYRFGPRIRNYYLIHFVTSGGGRFLSPRGEYKLGKGEAFLIKPGEVTVYEADAERPWEYIWIGFRGRLSDSFAGLPDTFAYDGAFLTELEDALASETGREALAASVIYKLYARLVEQKGKADYVNKVKSFINAKYMESVSISGIADMLGLNRKYLARIFKEENGASMQEYLINKRLHEAKKLLKLGYNVEESAYMVGYNDPFGFSKAFKKRYGCAPIEYRLK